MYTMTKCSLVVGGKNANVKLYCLWASQMSSDEHSSVLLCLPASDLMDVVCGVHFSCCSRSHPLGEPVYEGIVERAETGIIL